MSRARSSASVLKTSTRAVKSWIRSSISDRGLLEPVVETGHRSVELLDVGANGHGDEIHVLRHALARSMTGAASFSKRFANAPAVRVRFLRWKSTPVAANSTPRTAIVRMMVDMASAVERNVGVAATATVSGREP